MLFSSSQLTGVSGAQSSLQSIASLLPKHTPQSSKSLLKIFPVFPSEHISQSSIIAVPKQSPLQSIASLLPKHIPQSSTSKLLPLHTPQSSSSPTQSSTSSHIPSVSASIPSPPQTPQSSNIFPSQSHGENSPVNTNGLNPSPTISFDANV